MPKRKQLSKKVRFEVFKRDDFTCQYCGSVPPSVVLEIDHVTPVSKGGDNDINNLVTSCFDCNRGKTNIELDRITPALSENLEVLKAKEEQLREYRKFISNIKRRKTRDINKISAIFEDGFPERELTSKFKRISVSRFLDKLPLHEVEDAMTKAIDIIPNSSDAVSYFCGICWNKIRKSESR